MSVFLPHPRKQEVIEVEEAAVSESISISNACEVKALHFSFSETPSSENVVITLKNSDDVIVRYDTFDPSAEDSIEITRAYLQWTLEDDGGSINIEFDNTGDVLTSIVAVFKYQANE